MDYYFFNLINGLAGRWAVLDGIGVFFAQYLDYVLLFLVFGILGSRKRTVFQMLSAAVLARFGIVELIRFLLPRARPFVENNVNLLITHEASPSFPSGHAAFYFALAAAVFFHDKKIGLWFFLAAFLVSLARVFVGVHWPSDILAGAIVGIFSGWLVTLFSQRFSADSSK